MVQNGIAFLFIRKKIKKERKSKMKIDKITFKNGQAWIVIKSEDNEYLGTWHIVNPELVETLQKEMPKRIKFERDEDG